MTTQTNNSVVYISPDNQNGYWINVPAINVAGFGAGQIARARLSAAAAAGQTTVFSVQAPTPSPLWYFSTDAAGDSLVISTPLNVPITLSPFTAITGFNGGYFQPNPGQKFNIFYKNAAAKLIDTPCFNLQAIVENTLSQYIDMSSVRFEYADDFERAIAKGSKTVQRPEIRLIVTQNTVSAIPNTFAFDFYDYPVPDVQSALVVFKGIQNAQAIYSFGGHGALAANSPTIQYQIVGGQQGSIVYAGGRNQKFTGTLFLFIANIGQTTVPSLAVTVAMPTVFDETTFTSGVNGGENEALMEAITDLTLSVKGRTGSADQSSHPNISVADFDLSSVHDSIASLDMASVRATLDTMCKGVMLTQKAVADLKRANETAHVYQQAKLNELLATVKYSSVADSECDDSETKTEVGSIESYVRSRRS